MYRFAKKIQDCIKQNLAQNIESNKLEKIFDSDLYLENIQNI